MFNPSLHTATNKPIGLINKPIDARTYYYDDVNFVYRPYVSNAEVLAYLVGNQRIGQFSIIINTGGSVVNGVITGGTNAEWWFKNGVLDSDLLFKGASGGTQWGEIGGDINDQADLIALLTKLPDLSFKIPLGTLSPFSFEMNTYAAYGKRPFVQTSIQDVGSDGTILRRLVDIEPDYNYTDDTKTVLSFININGHVDDDGNFAKDTYIDIKANSPIIEIQPDGISFYKVKNSTGFDLKIWNNLWPDVPTGDYADALAYTPSLVGILNTGVISQFYLNPVASEDGATLGFVSGADDRTVDIYFNGSLQTSGLDIHDAIPFISLEGPVVGGNYYEIKEHV